MEIDWIQVLVLSLLTTVQVTVTSLTLVHYIKKSNKNENLNENILKVQELLTQVDISSKKLFQYCEFALKNIKDKK